MTRAVSINFNYLPNDRSEAMAWAQAAEEAGVDCFWVTETFGRDAFSVLTQLALCTNRAKLGTAIVNVHSRTPGALAQHFATLHELSNGRAIAGLGTSGPKVIEGFHGMAFEPAATRLRETVEIVRAYAGGGEVDYHGRVFDVSGFSLRFEMHHPAIPIMLGTLHPKTMRMTAELADGWLPIWIPLDQLSAEILRMTAWAAAAGRDPAAFTIRAPGDVFVVEDGDRRERIRAQRAERLAFFVARNGDFYYKQFVRHGLADEAAQIRRAWNAGGREAATACVSRELLDRFDFVGSVEESRTRLDEQAAAGVTLHQVMVVEPDTAGAARTLRRLIDD